MKHAMFVILFAFFMPELASAQVSSAALLPPRPDPQTDLEQHARAARAVQEALSAQGVAVMAQEDVQRRLAATQFAACADSPECARKIARELNVDITVSVTVWKRDAQRAQQEVSVRLTTPDGRSADSARPIQTKDESVSSAALDTAAQDAARGALAQIRVPSPTQTPLANSSDTNQSQTSDNPSQHSGSSYQQWLGPAILGGVGLVLATTAFIYGVIPDDCEVEDPQGTCHRGTTSDTPAIWIVGGAGLAAIAGAGIWLAINLSEENSSNNSTQLSLYPGGVSLRGKF